MSRPEFLYGYHPVAEALTAGRRQVYTVYGARGRSGGRLGLIQASAAARAVPMSACSPDRLRVLSGTDRHQGFVARVAPFPLTPEKDLAAGALSADSNPLLLLLDNILDPHNLGAILRSALAVGVVGVVTARNRSAAPTPAVSKASAGALEHVRLARVANLSQALRRIKGNGYWVAGLDPNAGRTLFEYDLNLPLALVIGGEERGMRPLVKKHCDFTLSIPQGGPVGSLNASVAAAVALFEARRQRIAASAGRAGETNKET